MANNYGKINPKIIIRLYLGIATSIIMLLFFANLQASQANIALKYFNTSKKIEYTKCNITFNKLCKKHHVIPNYVFAEIYVRK